MPTETDQIDELLAADAPATAPRQDEQQAVEALLTGDLDAPERAGDTAPRGDTTADDESADEVAEPEVAEGIDYAQKIPMTDGSKVTLGELKDTYQNYQGKLNEVITRENEVNTKYNEVQEFMGLIEGAIPPERLEAIKGQQRQYLEDQHKLMLQAMPEMADAVSFSKAKDAMFALGREYGVEDQIGQIADHRFVKMLHDYARLRAGIKAAKDNVVPLRNSDPKAKQKARGTQVGVDAAIKRARTTGTHQDQVTAINALLK